MKIPNTILYLLLTVCLVACDNDDIQFTKGDIPRDIAYKLALKELNVSLKDVDIWATKDKLSANTALKAGANVITSPNSESWLFFVDELPIVANWGHACKYVFINMNGEVFIQKATMFPNYERYNMELINISEARKNYHPYPVKPQAKAKSRSINLLCHHFKRRG